MVDNIGAILVPGGASELIYQLVIVHHGRSHLLLVLDRPEDNTQKVNVVLGHEGQISLVFPVFESIFEGYDGCTEEIFKRLAQLFLLVLYQSEYFSLERAIFFLHFLLLLDIGFLILFFLF